MRTWIAAIVLAGCGDVGTPNRDSGVVNIDTPGSPDDGAGPQMMSAFALLGGLDRVVIVKTRSLEDTCFSVTLVSPSPTMPAPDLSLPMGWSVESAQALRPSPACDPGYTGPVFDGATSKDQQGTIDWVGPNIPPSITKVDITLLFDMPTPAFPPSEALTASNLPVVLK